MYKDSFQPIHIFPAEIWRKILDELDDPRDLESASKAHPLFLHILGETRRLHILFARVLKLQRFQFFLLRRPPYRKLDLTCHLRLVCRSWRHAVDNLFELEVEDEKGFNLVEWLHFTELLSLPQNLRGRSGRVTTAIRNFTSGPGPALKLFTRSVELKLRGQRSEVTPKVSHFLERVGDQVLFLQVDSKSNDGPTALYHFLCRVVTYTPNLKWLSIISDSDDDAQQLQVPLPLPHSGHWKPFPTLRNLKALSLSIWGRMDIEVEVEASALLIPVLQFNPMVTHVEVRLFHRKGQSSFQKLKGTIKELGAPNVDVTFYVNGLLESGAV